MLGFCSLLSNFVGIRRNFFAGKFQYMYCIYFHIMLLLSYRICMKDPFEMGEAIYQFQMIDKNLQLQLDDETYTIILAIDCPKGKIPRELETFFTYVEREEVDENDDFVKRIHEKVEEVNRDTEVTEIMTIEEEMNIRWHYGYDEGEAAGAAQKQREIAKSMKAKSIPNADIAEITGLSAEEVEAL